jgi:hypothetical protein
MTKSTSFRLASIFEMTCAFRWLVSQYNLRIDKNNHESMFLHARYSQGTRATKHVHVTLIPSHWLGKSKGPFVVLVSTS